MLRRYIVGPAVRQIVAFLFELRQFQGDRERT